MEAEFKSIQAKPNNKRALENFQAKLSGLTFFDPACGAGNFLIIAYREIRRLETRILSALYGEQKTFRTHELSKIDVDQFYGIEINKFSASIAQTSLWMMDHMMNLELGDALGDTFTRIPIEKSPNVICADALEMDWEDLLKPDDCSYILGNPPFGGSKVTTKKQRMQVQKLSSSKHGGTLDYVCGWFIKAAKYATNSVIQIGFVSTNSITQGEQVWQLWHALEPYDIDIEFAYDTFPWDSDTKGKANVHVVIIGMSKKGRSRTRRLFYDEYEERPKHISPYLIGMNAETPIVQKNSKSLNGLPKMVMGSKPIDDGNYIFTDAEKNAFLKTEPYAGKYMRQYVGADEYINGEYRHILALHDVEPSEWKHMQATKKRVEKVKAFRKASRAPSTRDLAETPTLYHLNVLPTKPYLLIPSTSSERRQYVPIGYLEPPIIPNNLTLIVENAELGLFGLLTSNMHMVWLRNAGGRLTMRLRYSKGIVYNTFPVPDKPLDVLEPYAQAVLDARAKHPDSMLADLYDPNTMPPNLRKGHRALDRKVDRMYRKGGFSNDEERFEFLLEKYSKMIK